MALECRAVRDHEGLKALVPAWWDLWRRSPAATPFQSPAWLLPWWTCFHPGELRIVAAFAGDRLVALAPLYLEDGPQGRRLLPLGMSLSDYLDVLVDPDHADAAGTMLLKASGPDPIHWEELAPDASALRLAAPPGWRDRVEAQSACPVLALPDGIEDLSVAIPARKLRKLRMARNRAERRAIEIEVATIQSAPAMIDHLFRLHGERWNSRGEPGVLAEASVRKFHTLAWPALLEAGLLRLSTLSFDGVVAGVYYGLRRGNYAYAYLGGFDPIFSFESPGTILVGDAIEAAVRDGAKTFHFLRGQEAYKYEWGAVDRWNSRRVMEPRS